MAVALGFLPVLLLGVIVWAVVAIVRQRGREAFTLATGVALYARVMVLGGLVTALVGAGMLVKVGLGALSLDWSYARNEYGPGFDQLRGQDMVLGLTLLILGVVVLAAHVLVRRLAGQRPGGAPAWLAEGDRVLAVAFTGAVGLVSAAIAAYQGFIYALVPSAQEPAPFGEAAGLAIAFLPAWIVITVRLLRTMRKGPVARTPDQHLPSAATA